MVEATIED